MKALLEDLLEEFINDERIDWEAVALDASMEAGEEDEQEQEPDDPDIAYERGYNADAYDDNPFEHGTEASDRWLEGQDAAELDAMQSGELPTRYRDPD